MTKFLFRIIVVGLQHCQFMNSGTSAVKG